MLVALILNESRHTTITYQPHQLPRLLEKYGANLRVLGSSYTPPPAAPGTATVESFKTGTGLAPIVKQVKVVKIVKETGPKPVAPDTIIVVKEEKGPKATKPPVTPVNARYKPIVSITTGTYYESVLEAAKQTKVRPNNLSEHLRGVVDNRGKIRKTMKGQVFRFATPEEIESRQFIPTPLPIEL